LFQFAYVNNNLESDLSINTAINIIDLLSIITHHKS